MNTIKIKFAFLSIGILLFSNHVFSQNDEVSARFSLPRIALIDIEPAVDNSIYFTIVPSNKSGASPQVKETSNKKLWINYSSALASTQNSRSIFAEISEGVLPEGISLFLETSSFIGSGKGNMGQPTDKISLTNQPKAIITDVGNCYTGDGINNGHSLTFSIDISDYSILYSSEESTFTILYTISDY
ncbi:MAG: hypothetical protein L3J11_03040 [Draconibacterium sp.]|nr:hypothetical protein [Draconibacterium sp.]